MSDKKSLADLKAQHFGAVRSEGKKSLQELKSSHFGNQGTSEQEPQTQEGSDALPVLGSGFMVGGPTGAVTGSGRLTSGTEIVRKLGGGLGDVYGPPTELLNQAAFGALRPGVKYVTGLDLPQASSPGGQVMQGAAGLVGAIGGGPGRLIEASGKVAGQTAIKAGLPKFLANRVVAPIARGAVGGASLPVGDMNDRMGMAAYGAFVNPVAEPIVVGGLKAAGYLWKNAPKVVKDLSQYLPKNTDTKVLEAQKDVLTKGISGLAKVEKDIEKVGAFLKQRGTKEAEALSYKGAKDIGRVVQGTFDSARSNYKKVLESLGDDVMNGDDVISVLQKTLDDSGVSGDVVKSPGGRALAGQLEKFKRLATKLEKTPATTSKVLDASGKPMVLSEASSEEVSTRLSPIDIKNFKNEVFNSLKGEPFLEAVFTGNMTSLLESKGMEGISKAGQVYKKAYDLLGESKLLSKARIQRVATGKVPAFSEELSDQTAREAKFGTKYIDRARDLFEKYRASQVGVKRSLDANQLAQSGFGGAKSQIENEIAQKVARRNELKYLAMQGGAGVLGAAIGSGAAIYPISRILSKDVLYGRE